MGLEKYKIYLSPEFRYKLDSIYYYLFYNLKNPIVARNLRFYILKKVYSLEVFPNRYPNINIINKNIKKLYFNNFIILFKVIKKSKTIYILHIFHKNQNYLNLL